MKPYSWSMDGELWPHITPLMVKQGQRVEFELVNHTMMAHPIHLHGHSFQVIAIEGRPIQGAMRDTVLVMPRGGRVRIAFDADNPGRWAFHCHNLYHMQTGMMTEVRYDGLSARDNRPRVHGRRPQRKDTNMMLRWRVHADGSAGRPPATPASKALAR